MRDTCSMGLTCFKSWKFNSITQKGNRDVLVSPGSYFFLSNSCGQGEEWLKSLNKGVWIPFTGVFGQRLEETVLYERRYGDHMAPLVVEQCVDFIREQGLMEVGLFRQPGQATLVKELQEAFDAGEKPSFDSTDVHTVASLLKLYLRELPEPLVPFSRYQEFLICGKKISSHREQGLLELRNLLHELPVANFKLLKYICQFLNEVQSFSSTNKMSIQNLATVFGPNILRPKAEDPESIIGGAAVVQHLMSELIREHSMLFSRENNRKAPGTSGPAFASTHRQCSLVEWVYTKPTSSPRDPQLGLNSDGVPHPTQTFKPCSRKFSLPLMTERRCSSQSSHTPHHLAEIQQQQREVPSLASSTLLYENHSPSLLAQESPHSGLVPPPTTPPTASSSTITVAEVGHDGCLQSTSWPGLGQCAWETERVLGDSGGSSEAQDSTLSVYDNMVIGVQLDDCIEEGEAGPGMVDLEGGTARMADSNSSWSSCEILLGDVGSGSGGTTSPCHSSVCFPSFRSDLGESDLHPCSPASSTAPTDAPLSTGSSEVFLPNASSDSQDPPASQAIQCLVVGLRQQMARQKAEYEAKISRLEQRNEALQGQVAGLRATLEQQRRHVSVTEIKMRNTERARADADRRNATLQQEMEQFFDTFGELNSEARKTERIIQSF
ncbi:rho GTPase-activating protein 24 isoform X2 [Hemibagrus wyckioides]|uniref:rho GTPase-activating protein 24 isoform X2 n=1 Tax=Hemibagrus wyckioides TaxID=337641 RepID=UPI00266C67AD|nr:rho GTPase-activating protein 24 isoform X2 [Hemibagrus wyckioides]